MCVVCVYCVCVVSVVCVYCVCVVSVCCECCVCVLREVVRKGEVRFSKDVDVSEE